MHRKKGISAIILIVSLCWGLFAWAEELPDLGDPSQAIFPLAKEQKLGDIFMQQLRATGAVVSDPIDSEYINDIGQRLVANAKVGKRKFFFFFMADPTVNAFAGPGGYIAINSGLMLATEAESELAAVMAHEIAHVTQGHIARKIADASKMKYSTLLGILAGIAVGQATGSGDAAQATIAATVAGGQQRILNFSRQLEAEADRIGIVTLLKANFDPNSMPGFFQRLYTDERYNLQPIALLSSHPLTPDRIADAENRIAQYKSVSKVPSSEQYFLIKERLRVQTARDTHAIEAYYQKILKKSQYQNKAAAEYGYALALQASGKYAAAYTRFEALVAQSPKQVLYQLALADVLLDQNRAETAITLLRDIATTTPGSYPVVVEYAYALLKGGQAKQAVQVLNKYHLYYPDKPIPYGLLADAQAKSGTVAIAYQTRAKALVQMGNYKAALTQLEMALKLPHNDADTIARIKAQMDEIKILQVQNK
jgi:predicted Zn-dependent protease